MSAFYTFLSSLYNCLLKFILLIILGEMRKFLGEVLTISGEVQSHPRGGGHLPALPPKIRPCCCSTFDCFPKTNEMVERYLNTNEIAFEEMQIPLLKILYNMFISMKNCVPG